MKRLLVDKKIVEAFPGVHVGVVVARNINNTKAPEAVDFILREAEQGAVGAYGETAVLELPEIKAWRAAYKSFGAKKGLRSSIESLMKRVLKGDALPQINPLVDLYNAVSIKHVFPCGGEDLDTLEGNLQLTFASGTEPFMTIGSTVNEPPAFGEVVYKDDLGCACRCWNWREADRTKLTEDTQNAVLIIETLDPRRKNELEEALKQLSTAIEGLFGAQTVVHILNEEKRSVELDA